MWCHVGQHQKFNVCIKFETIRKTSDIYFSYNSQPAIHMQDTCNSLTEKLMVTTQKYTQIHTHMHTAQVQDFFLKNLDGETESCANGGISLLKNFPDLDS